MKYHVAPVTKYGTNIEAFTELTEDEFKAWVEMWMADKSWGNDFRVRRSHR